jgi:5,10-methylenetetrahydromethanopterin reductase
MKLSCAFATSLETPRHVEVAEQLGYERAWVYDSPALYPRRLDDSGACSW